MSVILRASTVPPEVTDLCLTANDRRWPGAPVCDDDASIVKGHGRIGHGSPAMDSRRTRRRLVVTNLIRFGHAPAVREALSVGAPMLCP